MSNRLTRCAICGLSLTKSRLAQPQLLQPRSGLGDQRLFECSPDAAL